MKNKKIMVIGINSTSTKMILTCLDNMGYQVLWVEENRDDTLKLIKNRVKKYGVVTVISQLSFIILQKILAFFSASRNEEILLNFGGINEYKPIFTVTNINEESSIRRVVNEDSDLIILSGARILSESFLESNKKSKIINIHAGITPAYRGVHGGYWALCNNDDVNFGSTIHFVDAGIDTGNIIEYARCSVTKKDSFNTYPTLQLVAALEKLPNVVSLIFNDAVIIKKEEMNSKLWTHPTIFRYLYNRLFNGIK